MRATMMSRWRPPDGNLPRRPTSSSLWTFAVFLAALSAVAPVNAGVGTNIPCKRFDEDPYSYVCEKLAAYVIPHMLNPSLTSLRITNSAISSLSNIDVYQKLQYLDISGNSLTKLGDPLSKLPRLQTVIARENKFTILRRTDLADVRTLTKLDLAKNQITKIEDRAFVNSSLTELDLSENRLKQLSAGSLQGLSKLQWLSLKDNDLIAVPESLKVLRQLNYLDLSFNSFGMIPAKVLPDVKTLLLERCDLSNTSFLEGSTLRHLDLSANRFLSVPSPLPPKLESLILDTNPIQTLPARSLAHVPNLRNFSLSACQDLRSVHVDAFAANAELVELRLESDVQLKILHSQMFRSLGKLQFVSLRESGLRAIEASFVSWYLLTRLDLRDNPLKCDCSLSWLRDLALAYRNSSRLAPDQRPRPLDDETVHISCAEPSKYAGQKLYSVPDSVFECRSTPLLMMIAIPIAIILLLASIAAAVLFCRRRGLPTWLPWTRKDKTAPSGQTNAKQQFLEKTYMMSRPYDGGPYSPGHPGHRLIPVTEL